MLVPDGYPPNHENFTMITQSVSDAGRFISHLWAGQPWLIVLLVITLASFAVLYRSQRLG